MRVYEDVTGSEERRRKRLDEGVQKETKNVRKK